MTCICLDILTRLAVAMKGCFVIVQPFLLPILIGGSQPGLKAARRAQRPSAPREEIPSLHEWSPQAELRAWLTTV